MQLWDVMSYVVINVYPICRLMSLLNVIRDIINIIVITHAAAANILLLLPTLAQIVYLDKKAMLSLNKWKNTATESYV